MKTNRIASLGMALAALAFNLCSIQPAQAGMWLTNSPMRAPRQYHTATLLANGKVLIAGGDATTSHSSAELYDPANGTWTMTGPMRTLRILHKATLLANGKVLVTGGISEGGYLASAELFDPAT
ncbi:MAG: kelch-like protein, partial [Verrucomicrobia bacterium]|nr:kelch-like protein [Verrucomicrobiota bacterium]